MKEGVRGGMDRKGEWSQGGRAVTPRKEGELWEGEEGELEGGVHMNGRRRDR
jgi:hypothetical protein